MTRSQHGRGRGVGRLISRTSQWGIMKGTAPMIGKSSSIQRVYHNNAIDVNSLFILAQKMKKSVSYLKGLPLQELKNNFRKNNMLSVNPLGSGGVGRTPLLWRAGNRAGYVW